MPKRTTIELDEDLLERARRVLKRPTTRATIEEALRRAIEQDEGERAEQAVKQRAYFELLPQLADMDVLGSEEMWR